VVAPGTKGPGAPEGRAPPPAGTTPRVHRAHGANDHRVIRILRAFLALPRALRLYPSGHARIEARVTELRVLLVEFFDGRAEPLEFRVRGNSVELNGEAIEAVPELASDFAFKLRRRRIRSLSLLPGVERSEIKLFAELFRTDYRQLLRTGGAHAFLARTPHPHLEISTFRGDGSEDEDDEPQDPFSHASAAVIAAAMDHPGVAERLRRLHAKLGDPAAERGQIVGADLERLTTGFFSRPEWGELDADAVLRVVESFLDVVEQTMGDPASMEASLVRARIASLSSFFRGVDPRELAKQLERVAQATANAPAVAYSTEEVEEMLAEPGSDLASTTQTIREHLEAHPSEENALLILCELMISALNRDEYYERRHMFLNAAGDERYDNSTVARILRHVVVSAPPITFETHGELVQAIFDHTKNDEALLLFLASITDRADIARPILKKLATCTDPFPLLVRLLTSVVLSPFRGVLSHLLVEAAHDKTLTLARWARRNRAQFFQAPVFEALFSEGTTLIGSICREILSEGSKEDRAVLIRRLRRAGSETALRLLVLGMPYGDAAIDPELLLALGRFGSPLAHAALREVVHRNNTCEFREPESRAALQALRDTRDPESMEFLEEVTRARAGLVMHKYIGKLRKIAALALDGKRVYTREI
jgi:predicted transcriptional regulator